MNEPQRASSSRMTCTNPTGPPSMSATIVTWSGFGDRSRPDQTRQPVGHDIAVQERVGERAPVVTAPAVRVQCRDGLPRQRPTPSAIHCRPMPTTPPMKAAIMLGGADLGGGPRR